MCLKVVTPSFLAVKKWGFAVWFSQLMLATRCLRWNSGRLPIQQGTRDCPVKLRSDLNRSEHPQPHWACFFFGGFGMFLASKRPKREFWWFISGDSCFLVLALDVSLKSTLEIGTKAHRFAMNDCMAPAWRPWKRSPSTDGESKSPGWRTKLSRVVRNHLWWESPQLNAIKMFLRLSTWLWWDCLLSLIVFRYLAASASILPHRTVGSTCKQRVETVRNPCFFFTVWS